MLYGHEAPAILWTACRSSIIVPTCIICASCSIKPANKQKRPKQLARKNMYSLTRLLSAVKPWFGLVKLLTALTSNMECFAVSLCLSCRVKCAESSVCSPFGETSQVMVKPSGATQTPWKTKKARKRSKKAYLVTWSWHRGWGGIGEIRGCRIPIHPVKNGKLT